LMKKQFKGYIRNLSDGTVEVVAEVFDDDLDTFREILQKGSPLSTVEDLQCEIIDDAEFTVSADMTSMPGAHTIKPVAVINHGKGMYQVHLPLEMYGEWALTMDFSQPQRDRVVTKVVITKTGGGSTHSHD